MNGGTGSLQQDLYSCHFQFFFVLIKNRKEFEGGLEKRKGMEGKSDKTNVKIPKQGRILEGGGKEFFWLARIYTPALQVT